MSKQPLLKILWIYPSDIEADPDITFIQQSLTAIQTVAITHFNPQENQPPWDFSDYDAFIVHFDSRYYLELTLALKHHNRPSILIFRNPQALIFEGCDHICQKCPYFTGTDTRLTESIQLLKIYDAVICFEQEAAEIFFKRFSVFPTLLDSKAFDIAQGVLEDILASLCDNSPETIRLGWLGEHLYHHSLALINLELMTRFLSDSDMRWDMRIMTGHERFDLELCKKYPKLTWRANTGRMGQTIDFFISHIWPPNFNVEPIAGKWIVIQPWEFGPVPKDWVTPIQEKVDELWVPSTYVKECFVESGITPTRIQVIANGLDADLYHPQASPRSLPTEKRFKFLFVGGSIYRKGFDILMQAYLMEFTAVDDICLVIKDFGSQSFYSGINYLTAVRELLEEPNRPEIVHITENLPKEKMPGLYTACNCYVHPYRGEGFGMPIAEAMACGLPVIVTDYGGCLDFCNADNAYLIPSRMMMKEADYIQNFHLTATLRMAEPDLRALRQLMRYAYEHPNKIREKGLKASSTIRKEHTWDRMFERIKERLQKLRPGNPIRKQILIEKLQIIYQQAMNQKNWKQAEAALKMALEQNNNDPQLLLYLSDLYEKQGFLQESQATLKKAWQAGGIQPATVRLAIRLMEQTGEAMVNAEKWLNPPVFIWDFPDRHWQLLSRLQSYPCQIRNRENGSPMTAYTVYWGSGQTKPLDSDLAVAWLHWSSPIKVHPEYNEIWVSDPAYYQEVSHQWPERTIYRVPLGIDTNNFHLDVEPLAVEGRRTTNLLGIFEWTHDYWKHCLQSYVQTYQPTDDIALLLKFIHREPLAEEDILNELSAVLKEVGLSPEHIPDVILVEHPVMLSHLPALLKTSNAIFIEPGADQEFLAYAALATGVEPILLGDEVSALSQNLFSLISDRESLVVWLSQWRPLPESKIKMGYHYIHDMQSMKQRNHFILEHVIGNNLQKSLHILE